MTCTQQKKKQVKHAVRKGKFVIHSKSGRLVFFVFIALIIASDGRDAACEEDMNFCLIPKTLKPTMN